jgi:hypothetical protein
MVTWDGKFDRLKLYRFFLRTIKTDVSSFYCPIINCRPTLTGYILFRREIHFRYPLRAAAR